MSAPKPAPLSTGSSRSRDEQAGDARVAGGGPDGPRDGAQLEGRDAAAAQERAEQRPAVEVNRGILDPRGQIEDQVGAVFHRRGPLLTDGHHDREEQEGQDQTAAKEDHEGREGAEQGGKEVLHPGPR